MQNRRKPMHINQGNDLKPHFGPFLALNGPFLGQHIFFTKIRKRHFSRLISGYLDAIKSEKTNGGKYDNFCHRQTDERTDRHQKKELISPSV